MNYIRTPYSALDKSMARRGQTLASNENSMFMFNVDNVVSDRDMQYRSLLHGAEVDDDSCFFEDRIVTLSQRSLRPSCIDNWRETERQRFLGIRSRFQHFFQFYHSVHPCFPRVLLPVLRSMFFPSHFLT